jgi:mannose-6-phosphate isomerase-like protein (cupin superfamily)
MLKKLLILTSAASILVLPVGSALAQEEAIATHVPESEIMAAYQGIDAFPDQQVRVVDIGGDINVAVGILRREATHTDDGEPVTSLAHHDITEVYYVTSGSGVLVTGGEAQDEREVPATTEIVRELVGPSAVRTVTGGQRMIISTGDVVVIPSGVAHGFSHILDEITYLSIRVDPNQVLPAGYKHPLID